MKEVTDEELMATHVLLLEAYKEAIRQDKDQEIFDCMKRYMDFTNACGARLGLNTEIIKQGFAEFGFEAVAKRSKAAAEAVVAASEIQNFKVAQEFGENLWHPMRRLSSAPTHYKLTPEYNKDYRILTDFWEKYEKGLDNFKVEQIIDHLQIRLDFYKQMLATRDEFALPKKKIDLLETALIELRKVFEAESAAQEEISLAAYEAKRVRELFNKIDRSASAPTIRGGH